MWTVAHAYEEARMHAQANAEFVRSKADHGLAICRELMPDVPSEEIAKRLMESNRKRLDAVPDLTKYPELRGMREIIDAQWRGTRDGAKLTDAQWAKTCDGMFYLSRYVFGAVGREDHGCTYVFFPESDHGPILANNLDSSPAEPFGAPVWPALNEHIIMGGVSSGIFGDELSPEIFPVSVQELLARYARSTAEAVEMLERYNYFWGPCNAIVIDRNRDVAMIEKSACRIGVRRSPDGYGFITAMTAEEPNFRAHLDQTRAASLKAHGFSDDCADTVYWQGSDNRRELLTELLDEARVNPTLEKLRSIIQFRDPQRGQVCYRGESALPGGPPLEWTLKTSIWQLGRGRALWWAIQGESPSWENRQPDVEFSDVLLWD